MFEKRKHRKAVMAAADADIETVLERNRRMRNQLIYLGLDDDRTEDAYGPRTDWLASIRDDLRMAQAGGVDPLAVILSSAELTIGDIRANAQHAIHEGWGYQGVPPLAEFKTGGS